MRKEEYARKTRELGEGREGKQRDGRLKEIRSGKEDEKRRERR
jgi:hypothetical protein